MKRLLIVILCLSFVSAKDYLKYYCQEYGVEIALVRAIRQAETLSGKLKGNRYEPHLKKKTWYTNILTKEELTNNDCFRSLGDLQILYGTAKSLGFEGTPKELKEPENNYCYAVKYILRLIHRYYYIDKVISAYNCGFPFRDDETDIFDNQEYVDRVNRAYKIVGGIIEW